MDINVRTVEKQLTQMFPHASAAATQKNADVVSSAGVYLAIALKRHHWAWPV
jgi:hypothetical protein